MIATTVAHACRHGGSERLKKNGHTVRGAQRAKCQECGRTFTLSPREPRDSEETKVQVLAAYQDRLSTRGVQRTCGVCYHTLMKWVGGKNRGSTRVRGHAFARSERRRAGVG